MLTADSDDSSVESKPKTSTEIMDDILKQLKMLDADKKRQIWNVLMEDSKPIYKTNTSSILPEIKVSSSIEDEVEILDLSERKMGTYKRKRSTEIRNVNQFSNYNKFLH